MIRKLKLNDVKPREDCDIVLEQVRRFLNSCDPDDRIELAIEVAER